MLLLWLFLVAFNIMDVWTTDAVIHLYGPQVEMNPISGFLIEHNMLTEVKLVILVVLGITCLWTKYKNVRIEQVKKRLWVITSVYLAVVMANLAALTHTVNQL